MFKWLSLALLLLLSSCEKKEELKVNVMTVPSNYEHLQGLEWLIGKWVDKEDDSEVIMQGKWDKNKNFLTQKFSVIIDGNLELEGFQIIGWDPIKKQIRSWVFDSDGGFGEGVWRKQGDKWIVESTQTLSEGKKGTSINIYSNIQPNSYTWESNGREVGGNILPNIEPVTVERK
jgi:hypothetical protein